MPSYKTPGVYIQEISKFPPSVAQVETAIPAFIGYTKKATDPDKKNLTDIPTAISSLAEFEESYGGAFVPANYNVEFDVNNLVDATKFQQFYMYDALRLFFDNGGGKCYIVSVGAYDNASGIEFSKLKAGIEKLTKIDEVTLILFPDAQGTDANGDNYLSPADLGTLQSTTLLQCVKLQDRFGVFDVMDGWDESNQDDAVKAFRFNVGANGLKYGAAYHPWVQTIYRPEISFSQLTLKDSTDTTLDQAAMEALTSDADTNALVTNMFSRSSDSTAVFGTLTGVTAENYSPLSDHLANKVNTFKGDPTEDNFAAILAFLREMVLGFKTLGDNAGLQQGLKDQLTAMQADAGLSKAILDLIRIEKNPSIMTELMPEDGGSDRDEGDVETDYAAISLSTWTGTPPVDITTDTNLTPETTIDVSGGATLKDKGIILFNNAIYQSTTEKILVAFESILSYAASASDTAEKTLFSDHPIFKSVKEAIEKSASTIPPSGGVVGVYARVDNARGVWKAPANVSMISVLKPAFKITNEIQDGLNVDAESGKSVNAIRTFVGRGNLIWGSRTLAGNDNEWRYVPVRRFFNMVEESVKKASNPFVFEPNDANTWVKVKAMIANFLTTLWRQGALAGATTDDAFFVKVGLGETMTAQDILEGRMNVEIGMAAVRPAEFIILKFSHKMQES